MTLHFRIRSLVAVATVFVFVASLARPALADFGRDPHFGRAGVALVQAGLFYQPTVTHRLRDGRILLAGYGSGPTATQRVEAAMLRSDGTVDETFADRGSFSRPQLDNYGWEELTDAAETSDGGILLVGSRYVLGYGDLLASLLLIKLDASGQLDPSFGSGGVAEESLVGKAFSPRLLLRPDDSFVIGCTTTHARFDGTQAPTAARFTARGVLDRSFGRDGVSEFVLDRMYSSCYRLLAGARGGMIMVCETYGVRYPLGTATVIVGLDDDGFFSRTFTGSGGPTIYYRPSGRETVPGDAFVDARGRLVVVGSFVTDDFLGHGTFVLRFLSDGARDRTFGDDGAVELDPPTPHSDGRAVCTYGDGLLVATTVFQGPTRNDSSDAVLTRLDDSGRPDISFGTNGSTVLGLSSYDDVASLQDWGDGHLAITGRTYQPATGGPFVAVLGDFPPDPDFALDVPDAPIVVSHGAKTELSIRVERFAGHTATVTVSAPDLRAQGIVFRPAEVAVTGDGASLTLKAKRGATPGDYAADLLATDGVHTYTRSVTIRVE